MNVAIPEPTIQQIVPAEISARAESIIGDLSNVSQKTKVHSVYTMFSTCYFVSNNTSLTDRVSENSDLSHVLDENIETPFFLYGTSKVDQDKHSLNFSAKTDEITIILQMASPVITDIKHVSAQVFEKMEATRKAFNKRSSDAEKLAELGKTKVDKSKFELLYIYSEIGNYSDKSRPFWIKDRTNGEIKMFATLEELERAL